jgi:lipid II:glycine glycyltransferase (peptidoglycan interpeptide bridge formation enzyme)
MTELPTMREPRSGRRIVADDAAPPTDWDERAVTVPGGHVMQSATWGRYRATQGFEPRYLTFDDDRVVLVLLRRTRGLPGVEASVRRGPAHAGEAGPAAAARAVALAAWATQVGARDLYLDPERPADPAYAAAMEAAGFRTSEGIEPSIHVMRLDFGSGVDPDGLWERLSKSTRQRIRAAERAGTSVAEDRSGDRLDAFALLLQQRAEVVGMQLQQGTHYLRGWRALMAAGLGRLLVADHEGELVGGLFIFRHGGIHATAYSADLASRRRELPGTMHLVRWTAICEALAEGCPAIELGGVDLPGRRTPPRPGDPNRGLYEHKRGFGAEWVEREPPRRIVLRPAAERLAHFRRRTVDALRGVRRWR